ncbi:PEP-CTERM sorting domain-containing protein [Pantanalinema rosaneae CENA516]|uniref:PEP-CTERM sorting domain-containing protein n=1 Tax=Pantanalinema rosaneae TaxID=1620701 RepID=UPI003D6E28FA
MTTVMQKFALATAGAAALAVGSIAPANAYGLSEPEPPILLKQFLISGTTGSLFGENANYFKEYQNAQFTGQLIYNFNGKDEAPDDPEWGIYSLLDFVITITNDHYPGFQSTLTYGPKTTKAAIEIDEFTTPIRGATVGNHSQYNPTLADFNMYFNCYSGDRNSVPDRAPCGFNSTFSFLTLYGVAEKPDLSVRIPLEFGTITGPVEAVPEPTTMAGIGVFGFGAFLKKRMARKAKS